MKTIKIGVIGPGSICHRFIKGAQMIKDVEVYAIAGRNKERAEKVALQYKIPYHGLIDDLIMDTNIDAVYVCTPNESHYEIVKKCLLNGKHVLCEKPMFSTIEELDEMYQLAYSKNLVLMEAMKALFLPLTMKVKQLMESGRLGTILYMDGKYSYKSDLAMDHWAYHPVSGGGMRDVGVYPLGYFNYLANSPIQEIVTMARSAQTGVDAFCQALVRYENGMISSNTGGLDLQTENKAMIYGTKGCIEIVNFWKASEAIVTIDGERKVMKAEMLSDFKYETEHFVECIRKGVKESPIIGYNECLEIMKVYKEKDEKMASNC